jgi:hypothetical protein
VVPAVAVVVGAAAEVVGDVGWWLLLPHPATMKARPITAIQSFGVLDGRMGINLVTPTTEIREPAAQPNQSFLDCTGR